MSRRIHITTRESIDRPGGLHNFVKRLALGQSALGHEVSIIDSITSDGRYHLASGPDPQSRLVAGEGPFELHFAYSALPLLRRYPRVRDTPSLFHFHGPWYLEGRANRDGIARCLGKWATEWRVYRTRTLYFTAASHAFAEILQRSFGVDPELIKVVQPGVDTDTFKPGDRNLARESLGIDHDQFVFACVRRLERRMGIDIAIRALSSLTDGVLVICGSGNLDNELRNLVSELGLKSRVKFLGRVSDETIPQVYQAADVSVVPTVQLEGFGLVVLESFSCGCPVIASDVGGLSEALGPFKESWTVPSSNVSALASRMSQAMYDSPNASESSRLRSYAETRSLRSAALEMDSVLETVSQ